MINFEFSVLYKNGHEDVIKQQATEEQYENINNIISLSFREDCPARITLGDGETEGYKIRMSDVSRIKVRMLDSVE